MPDSVAARSRKCRDKLSLIIDSLSSPSQGPRRISYEQVIDELARFSLWMGNIGALHLPKSPLSLESRLSEADEVLSHVHDLLEDLYEVADQLFEIASGVRKGEVAPITPDEDNEDDEEGGDHELEISEEVELFEQIGASISRLFRVTSLIRQAAPNDLFTKALSRNRYRFNDQFDVAHVGEKFSKLRSDNLVWLQKRLGSAITQRRHYLTYMQDHREKLEGQREATYTAEMRSQAPTLPQMAQNLPVRAIPDNASRPSTFFTKATTINPSNITPQMLTVEDEPDFDDDARSYTTISRSVDGDLDSSTMIRIPKLDDLRKGFRKEVECPFCFRMKTFKSERVWRRHVYSDLRAYICTFKDCDAPYFGDINEWFRHEMQFHRVQYSCVVCKKAWDDKDKFLRHMQLHPELLNKDKEEDLLDISRTPLEHIPAEKCPCCTDWVERLKLRAPTQANADGGLEAVITVVPNVFKRHLASHLEQLALFAIPIGSTTKGSTDSNVAIEEDQSS
ncbi:hypothetical protein B0J11DRAFT_419470, partial [Dendryphion nanum]